MFLAKFFENNQQLSYVRVLLGKALQFSIYSFNKGAAADILNFSKEKKLTLHIRHAELSHLIRHEAYQIIQSLVSAQVQIEKLNKKLSLRSVTKKLAQNNLETKHQNFSLVTLTFTDVV